MDPEDYHFKFRIVILGDKSVGKTSLLECKKLKKKKYLSERFNSYK
jgi:GTPase SAR1 family protein